MKIIFVVDSVNDIKTKLSCFKELSNDVLFVVRAPFEPIIRTYGININATYNKNLAGILHHLIASIPPQGILFYYSSLKLTPEFLTKFISAIGDGKKVVNVEPNYNVAENMFNGLYNKYVKTMFKTADSLASPKLQYLPEECVHELIQSHIANRMFEIKPEMVKVVHTQNKEISKSLKTRVKFNKYYLVPIMVILAITAFLLPAIVYIKSKFFVALLFTALYIVSLIVTIVYRLKAEFDARFIK